MLIILKLRVGVFYQPHPQQPPCIPQDWALEDE
jgi:hypothetical protein